MGKKYQQSLAKVDRDMSYDLETGLGLLSQTKIAKFDESVDVAVRLGVDPRKSDQMVRGAVTLPQGLGKKVRVLVFCNGEAQKQAKDEGAEEIGGEELIQKVLDGFMDFDCVISTPDLMSQVSKLGRILGPRGLMPNPKVGTVTNDVARAVKEAKQGQATYRLDKGGNVHALIGKVSFGPERLKENLMTLMDSLKHAKPAAAKGVYIRKVTVSTTMGPGVQLDRSFFN